MTKIIVHGTFDAQLMPQYASAHASGADLHADIAEPVILPPGERAMIPTGVRVQIPEGFEAQVRPRSGLAARNGLTVLNTPGTIDCDYRGEIKIILINLGHESFSVEPGMRIAQLVFAPVVQAEFIQIEELERSDRGHGGFGSTGI